jgi:hypothetical protein
MQKKNPVFRRYCMKKYAYVGVKLKIRVKLFLCLIIKHHVMKTWGNGSIALPFLTLVLDGSECQLQAPAALSREIIAPSGTHRIESWVDPRTGLEATEKRRILPLSGRNSGRSARSPSLYRLSYPDSCYSNFNVGQDDGKRHAPGSVPLVRNGEKSKWYQLHLRLRTTTKEARSLGFLFLSLGYTILKATYKSFSSPNTVRRLVDKYHILKYNKYVLINT